ncbi:MAG: GAF domain-containing protein [Candidatus Jordarchaeaceae archaeon]
MDVIEERKHNLQELVESGKLPMGITAYVVKTGNPVILCKEEVREHPEWRGSYEGAHEICTSVVEVPLQTHDGKRYGVVKIENHINSDSVTEFEKLKDPNIKIFCFDKLHMELLRILADSVLNAIKNVLYRAETYKKIFGAELLRKIDKLGVSNSNVNQCILERLKEFYNILKIGIEDIAEIDEIYKKVSKVVSDIANILGLQSCLKIMANVGAAFEPLLGTDVRYREHFVHQFQVFLLGYSRIC